MTYTILCPTCGDEVRLAAPGRCTTCTTFISAQFIQTHRRCVICGCEVHRERQNARYCSPQCARRAVYLKKAGQLPPDVRTRHRPDNTHRHAVAKQARLLGVDIPAGASLPRLFHKLAEMDAFDPNTPSTDREAILATLAEYVSQMPLLPHDYGVWRASKPWAQKHPFAELLATEVDFPLWPLTTPRAQETQGAQSHEDHQAHETPVPDPDVPGAGRKSQEGLAGDT